MQQTGVSQRSVEQWFMATHVAASEMCNITEKSARKASCP